MTYFHWKLSTLFFFVVLLGAGCATQQATKNEILHNVNLEEIQTGQFDTGKMWTFDFPPIDYFSQTYHFNCTKEWFEKARLSTLRLPNCTASFVSEDGLIMTNHHCARSALDNVTREGERLAEVGFYAATLEEERKASNIYIDQLIVIEDVTSEIQQAFDNGITDREKVANLMQKITEIRKSFSEKYKQIVPQDSMVFSVVTFYNGGRYSLYGYKRYTDVRLVYAPEEIIAFFGGDPDNFTYPRYDFDCAFFRVYDNGKPLKTTNFFRFSQDGAKDSDAVFVIGNPGSTSRLQTVAQLEFLRDIVYPLAIESNTRISAIYTAYVEKHPDAKLKYLNTIFTLDNARKEITGYLSGLRDPFIMAKKRNFEKKFKDAVLNEPELKLKSVNLWDDIARYQDKLSAIYLELNALRYRGRIRSQYLSLTTDLVDSVGQLTGQIPESVKTKYYPSNLVPEIEKQLLAFRLDVMKRTFSGQNKALNELLSNRTPQQAAEDLAMNSVITSKEKKDAILSGSPGDILKSTDPLISFIVATRSRAQELQNKFNEFNEKLQARMQVLGKLMYEIYGTQIPPDATFTLRIADGLVKGYEYNGTIAPPVTTFYGMYDRYYSFGSKDPWKLTDRWLIPPATFKMSTPMNFVSTNDIVGGNSGSPVINRNLQVVGLIFDGNIESLPGNIIFDETKNRSVSVHSAGLLEGLEKIYKADRIVQELRAGKIVQ